METLGDRIKMARQAKGYTQTELGAYAGIGKSAVSQWERNRIKNPTAQNLLPIAKALGKDPGELLTGRAAKLKASVDVPIADEVLSAKLSALNHSTPEQMNLYTIETLLGLKCKMKTWIIFLLANSDNKNTVLDEVAALKQAQDMLATLIEQKESEPSRVNETL